MRSFLHDGKRLIITAPYQENVAAISNGNHNLSSLKNGNHVNDLKLQQGASPTSSTCSIAGSVNSTLGSTH
jgi:hypothetical protein